MVSYLPDMHHFGRKYRAARANCAMQGSSQKGLAICQEWRARDRAIWSMPSPTPHGHEVFSSLLPGISQVGKLTWPRARGQYILLLVSHLSSGSATSIMGLETQEAKSKMGEGGIFLLAFTTTLREGIETVVFLAGVTAGQKVQAIILPCFVGLLMGLAVGVLLYYTCGFLTYTHRSPPPPPLPCTCLPEDPAYHGTTCMPWCHLLLYIRLPHPNPTPPPPPPPLLFAGQKKQLTILRYGAACEPD